MKVIIIGAGKVGYQLVESLVNENHDVTVVDNNQNVIDKLNDNFDVLAMKGNGVSSRLLEKLDCSSADLLIAVTNSDEANIVSCITAKRLGTNSVIARVRNPEYVAELDFMQKNLDIECIINPEYATAQEILRLLLNSHTSYAVDLAKGRVRISEVPINATANLSNKQIKDIDLPESVIITAIARNGNVIIPNGFDYIYPQDTIYIMGERAAVDAFARSMGVLIDNSKVRNVLIIGGGKTAFYLARKLEQLGINVKIIEENLHRCRELAEGLDNTLVLHGDGTDIALLKAENIDEMDAFVSLTGYDEENLLVSMLAKQLGAKKVIAKVSRSSYDSVVETIGLDSAVSPKLITARDILRIIRGGKILSMSLLIGGRAEVFEIIPQEGTPIVNKPLKDIGIPKGVIIGAIFRNEQIIIPNGDSVIKSTDRVIVFTLESLIEKVKKLFNTNGGGVPINELINSAKNSGDIASL
ncbi:MAG TPA: Trk system potassium transporter TrkA [Oscillospiraceae bacterium]|nr:Trk system potassium transporter TrkA [Oscillospiraceae bacterium]